MAICVGYIVRNIEERNKLKQFCIKNNIPITYPELFKDNRLRMKWVVCSDGVGLAGTRVMQSLSKQHLITDNLDELEVLLKRLK